MRVINIAGLKIRLVGGLDGRGGGTGPLVVLMHGYGASGEDLVPLAGELRLPKEVRFAFPEAPLRLSYEGAPAYPGMPDARAWWPIDMARLQVGMATRDDSYLLENYPDGLAEARDRIVTLLDGLQESLGVQSERIVLGGFSQGAILACDVSLHDSRPLAGLALLSGTFVGNATWSSRFAARRGTQVFQSHGDSDPVLPFSLAKRLHETLVLSQWNAEFVPFSGGHGIGAEALLALRNFLVKLF